MKEKQDRRVRRTKTLMRDALLELMDEKPFGEITAKDITQRADLNRATFYLHYNTVFDLLDELENEVVEGFAAMLSQLEVTVDEAWEYPLIGHICHYVAENPRLCRCLLLNPRSDRLAGKLTEIMKEKGAEVRRQLGKEINPHAAEYIHQFIACGAIGMVKQWLLEGMPLSEQGMTELAENMVRPIFHILTEGETNS